MLINWNELEALGVDWLDFCKVTGMDQYARNEGRLSRDEHIELNVKDFIKLTKEK